MSEEKLARKILRSFPKRFDMKVTAIEEAQYISNIKVDELIGSLQTFEMSLNGRSEKNAKSIIVSNTEEDEDQREKDTDASIAEAISFLNKSLKSLGRTSNTNVLDNVSNNVKNTEFQLKGKHENDTTKDIHVKALIGKYYFDAESSDGDEVISSEELVKTYKLLLAKWKESCTYGEKMRKEVKDLVAEKKQLQSNNSSLQEEVKTISKLREENEKLQSTNASLKEEVKNVNNLLAEKKQLLIINGSIQEEVTLLNSKLEGMTKSIRMMNNSTNVLEEILEVGKTIGDMEG